MDCVACIAAEKGYFYFVGFEWNFLKLEQLKVKSPLKASSIFIPNYFFFIPN